MTSPTLIASLSHFSQYLGYPDITTILQFWSLGKRDKKQTLEDLGKMFFEAANKL